MFVCELLFKLCLVEINDVFVFILFRVRFLEGLQGFRSRRGETREKEETEVETDVG